VINVNEGNRRRQIWIGGNAGCGRRLREFPTIVVIEGQTSIPNDEEVRLVVVIVIAGNCADAGAAKLRAQRSCLSGNLDEFSGVIPVEKLFRW
jgi:hypothetical protein